MEVEGETPRSFLLPSVLVRFPRLEERKVGTGFSRALVHLSGRTSFTKSLVLPDRRAALSVV